MRNSKLLTIFMLMSLVAFLCSSVKSQQPLSEVVTLPIDCSTISDAFQLVRENGRINVVNGTYYEYVNITKSVSLISLNSSRFGVVIDGKYRNYPTRPYQISVIGADNVVISGFTFLTTYSPPCAVGVYAENCENLTITNCTFEETCSWGIYLYHVSNAVIFNNFIDADYESLLVHTCNNVTITYNTLRDSSEQFKLCHSRNIVFHHNNVFNDEWSSHPTNDYPRVSNTTCTWDDGLRHGNYWSDYMTRYPNATNDSETWNTPYQIDPDDLDGREHFDIYPLMNDPALPSKPINITRLHIDKHGWSRLIHLC